MKIDSKMNTVVLRMFIGTYSFCGGLVYDSIPHSFKRKLTTGQKMALVFYAGVSWPVFLVNDK